MIGTILHLTWRSALGRRRALVLGVLPVLLLALALLARAVAGTSPDLVELVVQGLGLGTMMPLLGLIAGTIVIAPEIEDRSITWLLAKPIRRSTILLAKFAVAIAIMVLAGVLPVALAAFIVSGGEATTTIAYGAAATTAGTAYCALFCMLPIITRNAVFIGLAYALVWETLVGQLIPGAQALSVQQWSLAIAEAILDTGTSGPFPSAAVELDTGIMSLVVLTSACLGYATRRLRTVRLTSGAD